MQVAAARNAANWLCRVAQGFRPEPAPPGGRGHGPGPAVTQPGDGAGKAASERFPVRRPSHPSAADPATPAPTPGSAEGPPRRRPQTARRLDGGPAPLTMENPRIESGSADRMRVLINYTADSGPDGY